MKSKDYLERIADEQRRHDELVAAVRRKRNKARQVDVVQLAAHDLAKVETGVRVSVSARG